MAALATVKLGELDAVQATHAASKASVSVALYGGTLYSFVGADGKERLFVSAQAVKDGSKPLRGGVPLVFPQFGAGPLVNHGFARTSMWRLSNEPKEVEGGLVELSFALDSSEATRAVWPHEFSLEHVIRFGPDSLETCLRVRNVGETPFQFQALLHTYYLLDDIVHLEVSGLAQLEYIDQLQGGAKVREEREPISIAQETDAIYSGASKPIVLASRAAGGPRAEIVASLACDGEERPCDAVLWNPWVDKSQRMGDFGNEEYHKMVCLEPGCVSRFETCAPGQEWRLAQRVKFA